MNILQTISDIANGIISFLSAIDYSALMILFMVAIILLLLWNLNKQDETFSLNDLFVDKDGKASTSRISVVVALILSSWAFIHLTLNNTLTEWYFAGYMAIWVLNKTASKWIDLKLPSQKQTEEVKQEQ